jgi:hypothetical protein
MTPSISRRQVIAGSFAVVLVAGACLRATSENERDAAAPPAADISQGTNPFPLIGDIAERTW